MKQQPDTKLAQLRKHMAAGDWQKAIRLAARFQQLGEHRDMILSAQGAYTNPRLYRQLGKDPDAVKELGRLALLQRYGDK